VAGCIIGTRIGKNGYARLPSGKRGVYLYAHRVAWEDVYGPIPDGSQIHHRCGTKACVNVAHMELKGSFREHMRAHPPQRLCGHADRYTDSRGKSVCRTCRRERERQRYKQRRKREVMS
jgi:hypothetical protein